LTVEIKDDGGGGDREASDSERRGRGLVGMRERVLLFGGDFTAQPRPEGGFAVRANIPVKAREP
jgi:signal transduction histidine kinase